MATFRHKTIRRFSVGGFNFKNYYLRIDDEGEAERFRTLVAKLPRRDSVDIVEINEDAAAALERPVGPRVVRGQSGTGNMKQRTVENPAESPIAGEQAASTERSPVVDDGKNPDTQKTSTLQGAFANAWKKSAE